MNGENTSGGLQSKLSISFSMKGSVNINSSGTLTGGCIEEINLDVDASSEISEVSEWAEGVKALISSIQELDNPPVHEGPSNN